MCGLQLGMDNNITSKKNCTHSNYWLISTHLLEREGPVRIGNRYLCNILVFVSQ